MDNFLFVLAYSAVVLSFIVLAGSTVFFALQGELVLSIIFLFASGLLVAITQKVSHVNR